MKKYKILMDVNSIILPRGRKYLTGIGRSTLELLLAFQQIKQIPFELAIYSQRLPDSGLDSYHLPFREVYLPLPGTERFKIWVNRFRVKERLYNYDLFHVPHNYDLVSVPSKTVVTIHDAMFFSFPEAFLGHDNARELYPRLARTCRAIVTCSEASKSDIVHYMQVPPEKVTVIPWGVSTCVFHPEQKRPEMYKRLSEKGVERPYFLMVSCDEGRKNTLNLLKAFRIYLQNPYAEHDLVLAWNHPPKEYLEMFAHEIINGRIHFLDNVDDQLLRRLYNGATASFFPSRYEGFGMPVLESMACGTPVVTCRNSSLVEAGGNAALYTDPDSPEEMAQWMTDFEELKVNRLELRRKSLEHASHYTWQHTAEEYVKFYMNALQ